jgi:hypothetical protein
MKYYSLLATILRRGNNFMEEKLIWEFVHRVSQDDELRKALKKQPEEVISRENFSPRVASVITRLVPYLALTEETTPNKPSFWWGP